MKPTNIPGMTRDLIKPPNWDEAKHGACGSLPIRDAEAHGLPTMTSRWKPSIDELHLLNSGGSVELQVCGRTHPPVSIIAVAP